VRQEAAVSQLPLVSQQGSCLKLPGTTLTAITQERDSRPGQQLLPLVLLVCREPTLAWYLL
jgi:hypothetical protein